MAKRGRPRKVAKTTTNTTPTTNTKTTKLTASNLKNVLWNTIQDVREGKMDIQAANSVASISRATIQVARLEMDYMKATGQVDKKTANFITN